jgi:hypothetical protein
MEGERIVNSLLSPINLHKKVVRSTEHCTLRCDSVGEKGLALSRSTNWQELENATESAAQSLFLALPRSK